MENKVIWFCSNCRVNYSAKNSGKCPKCNGKLTVWDLSKSPLERKSEWPYSEKMEDIQQDTKKKYVDYTKYAKGKEEHDDQ